MTLEDLAAWATIAGFSAAALGVVARSAVSVLGRLRERRRARSDTPVNEAAVMAGQGDRLPVLSLPSDVFEDLDTATMTAADWQTKLRRRLVCPFPARQRGDGGVVAVVKRVRSDEAEAVSLEVTRRGEVELWLAEDVSAVDEVSDNQRLLAAYRNWQQAQRADQS